MLLWHIREGNYGNTRFDGLNVAMLGSFVGNVWAEHSDAFAAVFLDERADEKQREALQMIFGGQAGGWPATFGEIFGAEIRGMEYVPIDVFIAEDLATWSVDIPGKATATVEALTGPTTPEGLGYRPTTCRALRLVRDNRRPLVVERPRTEPTPTASAGSAAATPASTSPLSGVDRTGHDFAVGHARSGTGPAAAAPMVAGRAVARGSSAGTGRSGVVAHKSTLHA